MDAWERTVISGVQWSDKNVKENDGGRIQVARYVNVTFPYPIYNGLELNPANEEDAIVYGICDEVVTTLKGHRISDLLQKYNGGRIKSVNRNDNRRFLKNVKVTLG